MLVCVLQDTVLVVVKVHVLFGCYDATGTVTLCSLCTVCGIFCDAEIFVNSVYALHMCEYSVKDGEFRLYKGQRMESEIVAFVRDELWKELAPLPWYRSPTSIQ